MPTIHDVEMDTVSMPIDEFISLQDNPKQRDVQRHAKFAVKRHLRELQASHLRVAMVQFGKKKYKLDGHTRSYLWEKELLEKPSHVICDIYKVNDKEAIHQLYDHFDSQEAAENSSDKFTGALRFHHINAKSRIWLGGGGTTTVKSLFLGGKHGSMRKIDILDAVGAFKKSIKLFDRLGVNHPKFPAPILAAALLSLERDGSTALSFWEAYELDLGKKNPKTFDPVFAIGQLVSDLRANGGFSRGSITRIVENTPRFLTIYDEWSKGNVRLSRLPKSLKSLTQWIEECVPTLAQKSEYFKRALERTQANS